MPCGASSLASSAAAASTPKRDHWHLAPKRTSRTSAAAARLAAAVALGLLFAVSLTLFGGPIAHSLKGLQAEQVSTSQELPLRQ